VTARFSARISLEHGARLIAFDFFLRRLMNLAALIEPARQVQRDERRID